MNKKIKELAEKVYGMDTHYDDGVFAELIIKECVEQIIVKGTDWVDFAPSKSGVRPEYYEMAQHIKNHFGIE